MYHFCTITTYDHLYKVFALADSLTALNPETTLHVLCTDRSNISETNPRCKFYQLEDLKTESAFEKIKTKYRGEKDKLRWCMKPVFLIHLLKQNDKVIYLDNDICFFGAFDFLFDLLARHSFLLTPHHYSRNPNKDQNWFEANFRVGLFNAGFVGVNRQAINSLNWWAEACAYRCEKSALRGLFDDQKYLDLIPVMEENALIIQHKGCNVAEWNRDEVSRTKKPDGSIWLAATYPLIFIHFNHTTIRAIHEGMEPCLAPCLDLYLFLLKKYKSTIRVEQMIKPDSLIDKMKYYIWKLATDLNV